MTSRMSVAIVFIAPVIVRVAHLWIDASLLIVAWLAHSQFVMDKYNCWIYFAFIPCDAQAILLNWMSQSCPLARVVVHWAFQFSLLSTITPRNCAMSFDCMCWLPRVSGCHSNGILSFGLTGFGTCFFATLSSWNFLIPNLQLCVWPIQRLPLSSSWCFIASHVFHWSPCHILWLLCHQQRVVSIHLLWALEFLACQHCRWGTKCLSMDLPDWVHSVLWRVLFGSHWKILLSAYFPATSSFILYIPLGCLIFSCCVWSGRYLHLGKHLWHPEIELRQPDLCTTCLWLFSLVGELSPLWYILVLLQNG